MSISLNPIFHNGKDPLELSPQCIEEGKVRDEQFNSEIMADIIEGFELDIDNSYRKFTSRDIEAANLLYGGREDDPYFRSLIKLFNDLDVSTRGTPRLFVRPDNAYFLYKETNNTNVMVHLILENERWKVVEGKRLLGKPIEYSVLKCEEPLLKNR